jgi:hypothetical protein
MTSIRKALRFLAALVVVAAGSVATAEASTISIQPNTQTIAPGGTATVDIVLSGLTDSEIVGAFSLILNFNNAIVGAPESFQVDPDAKMGVYNPLNDFSGGFSGGTLDLVYLANLVTFPNTPAGAAALKLSEGTGFRLATVSFTGLSEGLSPLTLAVNPAGGPPLSAFQGTAAIPAVFVNGSICVDDGQGPSRCVAQTAVPEPATLSLLGAGLAAAAARRRRKTSKA